MFLFGSLSKARDIVGTPTVVLNEFPSRQLFGGTLRFPTFPANIGGWTDPCVLVGNEIPRIRSAGPRNRILGRTQIDFFDFIKSRGFGSLSLFENLRSCRGKGQTTKRDNDRTRWHDGKQTGNVVIEKVLVTGFGRFIGEDGPKIIAEHFHFPIFPP